MIQEKLLGLKKHVRYMRRIEKPKDHIGTTYTANNTKSDLR